MTNRVQLIRENSDVSHQINLASKSNRADKCGLSPSNPNEVSHWTRGREVVRKNEESYTKQIRNDVLALGSEDTEVKCKVLVQVVKIRYDALLLSMSSKI